MGAAVLAERIEKKFDPAQPRDEHGRWTLISAALKLIESAYGQAVGHEELGAPDHVHSSHVIASLHYGEVALHAVNEDGTVSALADGLTYDVLQDLSSAVDEALRTDVSELAEGEIFDVDEVAGFRITRGRAHDGTPYVALDSDEDGITFTDEHAEDVVNQLEALSNQAFLYDPEDPYLTRQLRPGETLLYKPQQVVSESDDDVLLALVQTPDGLHVRLGLGGGENAPLKDFTGGEGDLVADLDAESARRLLAVLDEAEGEQSAYDRNLEDFAAVSEDFYGTPEGAEYERLYNYEYNSRPSLYGPNSPRGLVPPPPLTEAEQARMAHLATLAPQEARYNLVEEGEDYSSHEIETPGATLRVAVRGQADSAEIVLTTRPTGTEPNVYYDEGRDTPAAVLSEAAVGRLRELLGDAFPDEPITKSVRATGNAGSARRLKRYWTRGKGLAKWIRSAHPWTTLRRHLGKYIHDPDKLDRTTSQWFHAATGMWSGERKGKNPLGRG